jgi:large subunit ribosomal protein L10
MAHVASWKKTKVKELADVMVKNPVVAIVDVHGIPSPQMQDMRHGLRKHAAMMMTRNNLVLIAIDEAAKQKPGLEKLKT